MGHREGERYVLSDEDRAAFERDGYAPLRGLVDEAEMRAIEEVYARFLAREIAVPGRDFCDMSGEYGRPVEEFAIVNVMLPRRYFPGWQGNVYERRAASVAEQLCGPGMALDYDQLVAKPPGRAGGVFHWHQDQAYWIDTPDTRTASFWLALDDTSPANGCLRFVPGSHREPRLRPHRPLHGDREKSHTLVAEVDESVDLPRAALLRRGDATVHGERTLHGSGANTSAGWRRGYVVAFRATETVAAERALGFTHSHNDAPDVLRTASVTFLHPRGDG